MKSLLYLVSLCILLNIGGKLHTYWGDSVFGNLSWNQVEESELCEEICGLQNKSLSLFMWGMELRLQYPFFSEPPLHAQGKPEIIR